MTVAPDRHAVDIISDVHGCFDELIALLQRLDYRIEPDGGATEGDWTVVPPAGRSAVFVGDFVDRGPKSPAVLRLAMRMVREGAALAVPGNHDDTFLRWLAGEPVPLAHGLAETVEQHRNESAAFKASVRTFLTGLPGHVILDDGALVVVHAGLPETFHGDASADARRLAMYGRLTGERDRYGAIRVDWATDYEGDALVVYGHVCVPEPRWVNNTVDIDTGCVFGHRLTALRYPEREIVQVDAYARYAHPMRPFLPGQMSLVDVRGGRA